MVDAASFNAGVVAEFRAGDGQVGGNSADAPLLLLHTIGARSGTPRINPVMYLMDRGRYPVFASKAGSDRNPDWFHNLLAHPDARIEVGREVLSVHAVVLEGQEHDAAFAEQARRYPGFAGYYKARPTGSSPWSHWYPSTHPIRHPWLDSSPNHLYLPPAPRKALR